MSAEEDLIDTEDAASRTPPAPLPPGARVYLHVLDGNSFSVFPLPQSGHVVVGRSPSADLRVKDTSVSRKHAQVVMEEGEVRIIDLESNNGIRVNGVKVQSELLQSGDVVALGNVTLIFHCGSRPEPVRPRLDARALRIRLTEELERVLSYERVVSILAVAPGVSNTPLAELERTIGGALRPMDLVGQVGSLLMVVLPELEEEAEEVARHLLEVLAPQAPQARVGLVSAPRDGLNAEALMAAARSTALDAPPGGLRVSGPEIYRVSLGERSMLVADSAMVALFEHLKKLAADSIPVLIHGETGTGKENAAWAVHYWSPRASGSFITINCAAVPEEMAESELFGHKRGAFTGSVESRAGAFEEASGGTLFLDEVGEMPLSIQAKLLRVLEYKRVARLGDSREREVDVRVVAATNKVLAEEVRAGRFREDLYYRLQGDVIVLPPLRDRPRELPLLATHLLAKACAQRARPPLHISAAAMGVLSAHSWPGNVRELKTIMERVAINCQGPILESSHVADALRLSEPLSRAPTVPQETPAPARRSFGPLSEEVRALERQRMLEALAATDWVQTRAASLLAMPLRTFAFKLKQYKISTRGKARPS